MEKMNDARNLCGAPLYGILRVPERRVGGDANIAPLGTIEFALDFRKNGAYCRVDVGIDPYEHPGRMDEHKKSGGTAA